MNRCLLITSCGIFNEELIRNSFHKEINGDPCEGYVIRTTDGFPYGNFRKSLAKFVSNKFEIAENKHWMQQRVAPNKIIE
ncbi:MAG: hypothetical protein HC836_31695 [Richelia sp. RM2_1_2]|nr:hypothetical protein [Richelia sp. RM2_1_2]